MDITCRWRTAGTILAREFLNLIELIFLIRLGRVRNLNLGRQGAGARSLADAAISHRVQRDRFM